MDILANHPDDELVQAAIVRVTNVYAKLANEKFGCKIPLPVAVDFDRCQTDHKAGGTAFGKNSISYNHVLARENIEEFLNQVAPHEVAHLGVYSKFVDVGITVDGHGPEWRELMRLFGLKPEKYHQFNVDNAKAWKQAWKKANKKK